MPGHLDAVFVFADFYDFLGGTSVGRDELPQSPAY
jgi:hypothetical protein